MSETGDRCRVRDCPFLPWSWRFDFCAEHYLAWLRGEDLDLERDLDDLPRARMAP